MRTLAVSETFYSIQGEGQTMGIPAVFLRLGGCNLLCESKNWRCDTIEVWRKSNAVEFDKVLLPEYIERLKEGAHLVITGGEPLMQQFRITEYLGWFMYQYKFLPKIEVETNGTIIPENDLDTLVNYWNVSPKLSTAGEQNKREVRVSDVALRAFNNSSTGCIFKFVISCEEDILEVLEEFSPYIDMKKVWFMPAGSTQEELAKNRVMVAEKCRDMGIKFCDRLHIVIWNLKTGV